MAELATLIGRPLAPQPTHQIQNYPASLIDSCALAGVGRVTLRSVLPQDTQLLAALAAGLSPTARRNCIHGAANLTLARVQQMTCVDYQQQMALVVTAMVDGAERLVADAGYVVERDGCSAEFALMVAGVGPFMATLNKSLAAQASLLWAFCGLANPRHSLGYGCSLRLASHPKPGRPHSRGLVQRRPISEPVAPDGV